MLFILLLSCSAWAQRSVGNGGGIAEIQIRTKEMHAEAAYGIAAHYSYKETKSHNDKSSLEWIEELKDLNHIPDEPKKFMETSLLGGHNAGDFIVTKVAATAAPASCIFPATRPPVCPHRSRPRRTRAIAMCH